MRQRVGVPLAGSDQPHRRLGRYRIRKRRLRRRAGRHRRQRRRGIGKGRLRDRQRRLGRQRHHRRERSPLRQDRVEAGSTWKTSPKGLHHRFLSYEQRCRGADVRAHGSACPHGARPPPVQGRCHATPWGALGHFVFSHRSRLKCPCRWRMQRRYVACTYRSLQAVYVYRDGPGDPVVEPGCGATHPHGRL
jgi:hypothetical protein